MLHVLSKFSKPNEDNNTLSVLVECDETEQLFIARVTWDTFEDAWREQASWAGVEDEQLEESYYLYYNDNMDFLSEFVQDWHQAQQKGKYSAVVTLEPYIEPKLIVNDNAKNGFKPSDATAEYRDYGFVEASDFHSSTFFVY